MLKYLRTADAIPDALAATSIGSAGASGWLWLANINQILATVAALVAIASGIYSIYKRSQNGKK